MTDISAAFAERILAIAPTMLDSEDRAQVGRLLFDVAGCAYGGTRQQTVAAICGAIVGVLLGQSAWPLVGGVAAMGCLTLGLWVATIGIRRGAATH